MTRLVAIVGPSGAGKDTLIRGALAARPDLHLARRVITRPADTDSEDFDSVTEADFADTGLQYMIGLSPCAIDFLTSISGLDFDEAWLSKKEFIASACRVYYVSPRDLIRSKRAAGRTQDLADIEEILRILPDADKS